MRFHALDTVVLNKPLPKRGLCVGDLGAVVGTYEPDGLDVEFVTASGQTRALVTLKETDVREVRDRAIVAVRSTARGAAPRGGRSDAQNRRDAEGWSG